MSRTLVAALIVVAACLGLSAQAQASDPEPVVPPAFAPPAPAPVVDVASAEAFAEGYATRNAARFLRADRRRVRVLDANAACLEHPVIALRFGCVFTLRAITIERSRGWDGWGHDAKSSRKHGKPRHDRRPRFRIRTYGCLGALSVTGSETAAPTGTLRFVECARVRNADYEAPEPAPVA